MSRIGQLPIQLPSGVTIEQKGDQVVVTGPKGNLSQKAIATVSFEVVGDTIFVRPTHKSRETRPLHGLFRQLLANMVTGVSAGFSRQLEMKGTGYRAQVEGNDLVLSVGFSHPVRITAPEGISFKVEKNVLITVEGINRQVVGEVAANIRAVRKPEPYKGKGIRYSGEHVRMKPGKAAKAAATK